MVLGTSVDGKTKRVAEITIMSTVKGEQWEK
jgi:hypothetical protein